MSISSLQVVAPRTSTGGQGGDFGDSDRVRNGGESGRKRAGHQSNRPGGNVTGVTFLSTELGGKRLISCANFSAGDQGGRRRGGIKRIG